MLHQMKLNPTAFDKMKSGEKVREYRLNDPKRRRIQVGDVIEFFRLPDLQDSILRQVEEVSLYRDWNSCYSAFFDEDFAGRYASVEAMIQETYQNWWPPEDEARYGCLILHLRA